MKRKSVSLYQECRTRGTPSLRNCTFFLTFVSSTYLPPPPPSPLFQITLEKKGLHPTHPSPYSSLSNYACHRRSCSRGFFNRRLGRRTKWVCVCVICMKEGATVLSPHAIALHWRWWVSAALRRFVCWWKIYVCDTDCPMTAKPLSPSVCLSVCLFLFRWFELT